MPVTSRPGGYRCIPQEIKLGHEANLEFGSIRDSRKLEIPQTSRSEDRRASQRVPSNRDRPLRLELKGFFHPKNAAVSFCKGSLGLATQVPRRSRQAPLGPTFVIRQFCLLRTAVHPWHLRTGQTGVSSRYACREVKYRHAALHEELPQVVPSRRHVQSQSGFGE